MIYRQKYNTSTDVDELSFTVSVTSADVRRWIKAYYTLPSCADELEADGELIYNNLFHDYLKFWLRDFPQDLILKLAEWAWKLALRDGYIYPSKFTEGRFHFSRKLVFGLSGTWERPPKSEAITKNFEEGENS